MAYLDSRYDPWLVVISILLASFASFVALDLARRVRNDDRLVALCWGVGGSVMLGSGIWAMHFVGMMAFSLPIALGYGYALTALSWLAGVGVCGIALAVASIGRFTAHRVVAGALAMGGGISAMHYIGMAAIDLAPGIVWNAGVVAGSAAIAVAASAAALGIFRWLPTVGARHRLLCQLAAALVMGLAISGTHYAGMAAANFPQSAVCLSAEALSGGSLGGIVILGSLSMLALTLVTSLVDGRLRDKATRLAASLRAANAELQAANASLQTLAFRDSLTNLPNRLQFDERLKRAVERIDRQDGRRLAVLFVDLDGFKAVNDSFGHARGDGLLRSVAERLCRLARDGDTVARVGGDEFVLMAEDSGSVEDCAALARRIVERLALPFEIAGRPVSVSASVGVVVYPDDGAADKLLAHADAAMHAAKRAGGASYALFEPHMDACALEQLSLQTDLRQAIERGELQLYYQPKIDAKSGRVAGVEALLRWRHPQRGMVSPVVFIPIAERFGLIGPLGDWVIDEACRQMGAWAAAGQRVRVAINLSVHQLRHAGLAARIEAALRRHGVDAADLLCEITESAAMDDWRASRPVFDELVGIGVYLSIDDFGTGYSSLAYLRRLPARQLKIDRSFVNDLETSADARALVNAVLSLAHALGLRVVAEGVETAGQRDVLRRLGCDELQGYLFAQPMPAAELPIWTARHAAERAAQDVEPNLSEEPLLAYEAGRRAEYAE